MKSLLSTNGFLSLITRWFNANILALGREMRLSYLPPLMVYVAAGVSGLTGIVGTFYVKEKLGLSAEFLAMLGFWMMLPWALKMPIGHLVDLIWRWKSLLVYLGAIMVLLLFGVMLTRAKIGTDTDLDNEQRWIGDERVREPDPLLVPLAQLADDPRAHVGHVRHLERRPGDEAHARSRTPPRAARDAHRDRSLQGRCRHGRDLAA